MPWVKMSTKFFEDPKLDGLTATQILSLIWLITESGRQNLGQGMVRVHASFMKSSLRLQRSFSVCSTLSSLVQRGVIIEIESESTLSNHAQELRGRVRDKNPLNPLTDRSAQIKLLAGGVGNKFPSGESGTGGE